MLFFTLPVPPSVNEAFLNRRTGKGRGRIKSAKYHSWLRQADGYYWLQYLQRATPIRAPYDLKLVLPDVRGDIDNRVKLVVDYLVSRNLTPDDKHMRRLEVERDPELKKLLWISVRSAV